MLPAVSRIPIFLLSQSGSDGWVWWLLCASHYPVVSLTYIFLHYRHLLLSLRPANAYSSGLGLFILGQ